VYKPAGIHSVRLPSSSGGVSLADLLLRDDPTLSKIGAEEVDAGLVMRLDLSTSGILLGAKTEEMWRTLHDMIASGDVDKHYIAQLEGELADPATIESYIGSPHRGAKKMKVYEKKPAKSARALQGTTQFVPLSYDHNIDITTVKAIASPARRHQIRVHASYIGHPLVGDTLYGSTRPLVAVDPEERAFFLHAAFLSFTHPLTAERVTVECPY